MIQKPLIPAAVLALSLLGIIFGFGPAIAQPAAESASPPASVTVKPPIASEDELRAYLSGHRGEATPFDAFVPASRAEFIASLRFGRHGVSSFNITLFQDQLTDAQRIAVLTLFGMQDLIADFRPQHELSEQDRQKVRRIAEIAAHPGMAADPIEQSYADFARIVPVTAEPNRASQTPADSERSFRSRIQRAYDARFAPFARPGVLRVLGAADVIDIFRATAEVAFYTNDPSDARTLLGVHAELTHRNLATSRNDEDVLDRLVGSRLFGEARAFAAKHRELAVRIPELEDRSTANRSGPSELLVSDDAKRLVRRPYDFSASAQVIVVSSPFCHFCQNAVHDIARVPALEKLMQRHSHWLATQDGAISLTAIHEWNVAHRAEPMTLVYREEEWPMVDSWATPTFYFFKKKTLVAKLTGWPGESRVADLERALHDIGAT